MALRLDGKGHADGVIAALKASVDAAPKGAWLRQIGPRHVTRYLPGGPSLLVAFEDADEARARDGAAPWGDSVAAKRSFSTLTIVSDGRTWFRDEALTHLFDELTDEEFFDDFDTIVFAGGGAGGYASAAYSVAAPGAIVFAVQPVATLDRRDAPWERRYRSAWALDWSSRYGYAPEMIEAASRVFVLADPTEVFDAMHASLFRGRHVVHLRAVHGGSRVWHQLRSIGILDRLVAGAEAGNLTPLRFAQLWRGRRRDRDWLAGMMRKLDRLDRPFLTGLFARHVTQRLDSAAAQRRLIAAQTRLAADDRSLPGEGEPAAPEAGRATG